MISQAASPRSRSQRGAAKTADSCPSWASSSWTTSGSSEPGGWPASPSPLCALRIFMPLLRRLLTWSDYVRCRTVGPALAARSLASSRILLFALVAAASPSPCSATAAVLTSRRGRTNGTVYLVGFLLGQSIAFVVALLIGSAATTNRDGNEELAAALELAFGVALLAVAWPWRHASADPNAAGQAGEGPARPAARASPEHRVLGGPAARRRRRQAAHHHGRRGRDRRIGAWRRSRRHSVASSTSSSRASSSGFRSPFTWSPATMRTDGSKRPRAG